MMGGTTEADDAPLFSFGMEQGMWYLANLLIVGTGALSIPFIQL